MPSLSIVIPSLGDLQALESSLVSVLQNRPHDCEVLVVLNHPYDDPYDLSDEVRFVQARKGAGLAESANLGLRHSRAPILHLLAPGVEVSEDWTGPALVHFKEPGVAAVAPVVLDVSRRQRVLSAGVNYGPGGLTWVRRRGRAGAAPASNVLGPGGLAAFYRRSAWEMVGGFEPSLGDQYAHVDLALQHRYLGFRTVLEPTCRVFAPRTALPRGSFAGLAAERLFLRNAAAAGWLKSLALHPLAVGAQTLSTAPWKALAQLAGRCLAWTELPEVRRHRARLEALRERDLRASTHSLSAARRDEGLDQRRDEEGNRLRRSRAG